jgi:hypothetical protein
MNVKIGVIALAITASLLLFLGLGYGFGSSGQEFVIEANGTPVGNVTVRLGSNKTEIQSALSSLEGARP